MNVNETQLVCIASFKAVTGKEDVLLATLFSLIEETKKEGGCIRYELNQSIEEPTEITFVEKWYDLNTFEKHCATDYIANFFKGGNPDNVESYNVKLYQEIL